MNDVQLNIRGESWFQDEDLVRLMTLLNRDGDNARIVGGAVRDALFNIFWKRKRKIGDIDIASRLTPLENIELLEQAGIKVVATGLKHGTITAVINKKPFEITTLRKDIRTDGRHAEVEFSKDWSDDARRRDFTINALYLGKDGTVYDPLDSFQDIKAARVRFIGDARKRIREDALRILRFFRFSSDIEVGGVDEEGMLAAVELKDLIGTLSGERIRDEFKKILTSKRAMQTIPMLATIGLLREILPECNGYGDFLKYIKREKKLGRKNVIGRFSCLLPKDEKIIVEASRRLKLSNKERDQLIAYSRNYERHDLRKKTLRRVLYLNGKDVVIHNLIRLGLLDKKSLGYINEYQIPEMPLSGKDLMKEGWEAGRDMGEELKRRETAWIDADFNLKGIQGSP